MPKDALAYIAQANDLLLKEDPSGAIHLHGLDSMYFVFRKAPSMSSNNASFHEGEMGGISSSGSQGGGGGSTGSAGGAAPSATPQGNASTGGSGGQGVSISSSDSINFWEDLDKNLKATVSKRGFYTIDKSSSSVYIVDTPARVKNLKELFRLLDGNLNRQVELQVTILEVRKGGTTNYGFNWDSMFSAISGQITTFETSSAVANQLIPFKFGVTGEAWNFKHTAVIRAAEKFADVKIIEKTNMLLRNNTAGSISRGIERSYLDSISRVINQNTTTTTVVKGKILSGLNIYVVPTIVDDTITLTFMPRVTALQDIEMVKVDQAEIQNPVLDIRKNVITVTLKNGETKVVASLSTDKKGHTDNNIPMINKIPVIGWLFGTREVQDEETALLFILTPKIIEI